jgi:hypothetical protein
VHFLFAPSLLPAKFSILSTELRVISIAQACESGTESKVNDNTKMLRAMKTLRLLKLLKVVRTFEFFGYALSQPGNACFEVGRGFLVESASNDIGKKTSTTRFMLASNFRMTWTDKDVLFLFVCN